MTGFINEHELFIIMVFPGQISFPIEIPNINPANLYERLQPSGIIQRIVILVRGNVKHLKIINKNWRGIPA